MWTIGLLSLLSLLIISVYRILLGKSLGKQSLRILEDVTEVGFESEGMELPQDRVQ
jgi:hypothetical protein